MTAPESGPTLLAGREALATEFARHEERFHGMWADCTCGGWSVTAEEAPDGSVDLHRAHVIDMLLASGVVRGMADLSEDSAFLYRVTNAAIPLHPTGRVTVTETQAILRALAAALGGAR